MSEKKDYYKILGITDDEKKLKGDDFNKAAQKKFRALSLKYHPDRFASKSDAEKKEAEEKFKEINEAYQTLTDENKRKEYDNPNPFGGGGNPFGGFGGFEDIFGGFGNMFRGGGKKTHRKGSNIRINFNVELSDILNKTKKKVKYNRQEGNGKTCPTCGGTGQIFKTYSQGNFAQQILSECPNCHGSGVESQTKSHECEFTINGIDTTNDVQFNESTRTVSFVQVVRGEGNTVSQNPSDNGDLIVIVSFKLPNGFKLETANDVSFEFKVPILTALLGGEIEVTSLDGTKLRAKVPQGVVDGNRIRFGGKGLMANGKIGDMYGIVKLILPSKLNQNEVNILNQLKGSENFK